MKRAKTFNETNRANLRKSRALDVADLVVVKGESLRKTGAKLEISQQRVRQLINFAVDLVRENLSMQAIRLPTDTTLPDMRLRPLAWQKLFNDVRPQRWK